jgi:hypothetical protein
MKFVKWLIIAVAAILGIFIVITFFLPKDYYVERSIEIEAPALLIFANVADLEAWQTWNPWNEMDPDIEITFGEKTVGTGASYTWVSEKMGGGESGLQVLLEYYKSGHGFPRGATFLGR